MSTAVPEVPAFAPLVAVTATARLVEGVERVRLNAAYVRALESVGLVPIVVPPLKVKDFVLASVSDAI